MIDILILLMLWLMSCAICAVIGFFVACKGLVKQRDRKPVKAERQEVAPQMSREQQEYLNMLTYDGTPQEPIDAERR